jgi:hypothetical protein
MLNKTKGVNGKGSGLFYTRIFMEEQRRVAIVLSQDSLSEAGSSEHEILVNPSRCSTGKRL